jgi:hypothetical protein
MSEPENNGRNTGGSSECRGPDGRFAVGNHGRIPGVRNKATKFAELLFDGSAEKVCQAVIETAEGGDMVAAKIVVERILPPRKDRPISFEMPKIESVKESSEMTASLLTAVARGEVTPEEGMTVARLIETHSRIREGSDFEARLKALEERIGHGDAK